MIMVKIFPMVESENSWKKDCKESLGLIIIQLTSLTKWFGNKTKGMIEWMIVYWLKWCECVGDEMNSLQWIDDIDNLIVWWDDIDIGMLVLVVPFSVAANLRLLEFLSPTHEVRRASGGVRGVRVVFSSM